MQAADRIRKAVQQVSLLRQACAEAPALHDAVTAIKRLQARRFAGTYSDMLAGGHHEKAARFFLDELYSDKDYTERDLQFVRIAGPMQTFFPDHVVQTAVGLAELHALTEDLDHQMAQAWLAGAGASADAVAVPSSEGLLYAAAWRVVGRQPDRLAQLNNVLGIGREMIRLTRKPGLQLMLRMMRGPAAAGGMASLQTFLETGFDTFARMARSTGSAESFLQIIEQREAALMTLLFEQDVVASGTQLQQTLGQAR